MAKDLTLVRPNLSDDKKSEIVSFVTERWKKAVDSRTTQIDMKYKTWVKNYDAIPMEEIRTTPWYKASNLIVPLSRIYIDTFVARTLNLVFATRPLYTIDNLVGDTEGSISPYLNFKAMNEWGHYDLAKNMLLRGAKTGTRS